MGVDNIIETLKYTLTGSPLNNYNYVTIEEALMDDGHNCKVFAGATKLCIIPHNSSLVIKIPFNQTVYISMYEEDCYNWEIDEDKKEDEKPKIEDYIHNLDSASDENLDDDSNWDYCRLECMLYEAAYFEGLSKYFAHEEWYCEINGHPIYLQQRATPLATLSEHTEVATLKRTSDFCSKHNIFCFDTEWISDFLARYGEAEFLKLNKFLSKYHIDDLRDSNIGYIDERPILFDYSGYREYD